jgi:integrase/recombinase XerC/integrase/recombinase XerD
VSEPPTEIVTPSPQDAQALAAVLYRASAAAYTDRAASHRVTAAADLDPESRRARLSYEMAEQLFKENSGGKTLHQLRHSRLTHLGDTNVSAPLLMAISGHRQLATLQQYVKPSQAAEISHRAIPEPCGVEPHRKC